MDATTKMLKDLKGWRTAHLWCLLSCWAAPSRAILPICLNPKFLCNFVKSDSVLQKRKHCLQRTHWLAPLKPKAEFEISHFVLGTCLVLVHFFKSLNDTFLVRLGCCKFFLAVTVLYVWGPATTASWYCLENSCFDSRIPIKIEMWDVESTTLVHIKIASVIKLLSRALDCGSRLFRYVTTVTALGFQAFIAFQDCCLSCGWWMSVLGLKAVPAALPSHRILTMK